MFPNRTTGKYLLV